MTYRFGKLLIFVVTDRFNDKFDVTICDYYIMKGVVRLTSNKAVVADARNQEDI